MFTAKVVIVPGAFLIGAAVLAQTPPAPPIGMSLQQFLSVARGRIMDRDADGDGRISAAEFAAGAGARPHAKRQATDAAPPTSAPMPAGDRPMAGMMSSRMFQRFDTNGDGYLDKAEVDAMLTKRFERMDTNHDGIVTAAEREASRGSMRGRNGADE